MTAFTKEPVIAETGPLPVLKEDSVPPVPTVEQLNLGILPPALGDGTLEAILEGMRSLPCLPEGESEAFDQTLAEARAERRSLVKEKGR